MLSRRRRKLRLETLENRRVLTVATSVLTIDLVYASSSADQVTADFNGDGITDVLEIPQYDSDWTLNINDGTQRFGFSVGEGVDDARYLGTGDFNQDSLLDVISFDEATGDLWVSLNRKTRFEHQRWGNFTPTTTWTQLFVGDFDNDGLTDLLGGEAKGHWWLAKNHQGKTFQHFHWGRFQDYDWIDVLDGDFTGDGKLDIVARAPGNSWWLWESGDDGFELARYFGHWKMRDQWWDVSVGDFDGDFVDDVIGRSEDGKLWVGSSTPNAFHTWTWGEGWIDAANWSDVSVLDVNGDQLPDQIGRTEAGDWAYALNVGGKFQNHQWQSTNPALDFAVASDYVTSHAVDVVESFGFDSDTDLGSNYDTPGRNNFLFSTFLRDRQDATDESDATGEDADPVTSDEPMEAEPLRVSLADNNQILLTPPFTVSLAGIEITSASGSLIPVSEITHDDGSVTPAAAPFQFLLRNTPTEITYGNLGSGASVTEPLKLARWVPNAPGVTLENDLTIRYGREATGTNVWLAEIDKDT